MSTKKSAKNTSANRNIAKERFWRDVFRRQAESNETVLSFCRRHKLVCSSFYNWRNKILNLDNKRVSSAGTQSGFAQVILPRENTSPDSTRNNILGKDEIEIKLASGSGLRIGAGVPLDRISDILQIINA